MDEYVFLAFCLYRFGIPPRDNHGEDCSITSDPALPSYLDELPDHIAGCKCSNHHGVCKQCGYKVTIGPEGVERGHARKNNRSYRVRDGGCRHRPKSEVNPNREKPQVHGGKKGGAD